MLDTIEFGRFFVGTNEAKFQHGTDSTDFWSGLTAFWLSSIWSNSAEFWPRSTRSNFGWGRLGQIRTNFGRGRRDQIWVRVDSAKFQSRST